MNNVKKITNTRGMTLIETLVAITILTVAIVAPMSLTMQSLSASYYARDQIIAFNLGQEAIESVRSVRDGNILRIAYDQKNCNPMTLLCGIVVTGEPFIIDVTTNQMEACPAGGCPMLQTNGDLYGYDQLNDLPGSWEDTRFKRSVIAEFVPGDTNDEIRVVVTVEWEAGPLQTRTFTIYENLYRWVNDDSI
jgi:prepilin-type N-terminal cleavage/methylation domain-containing protein